MAYTYPVKWLHSSMHGAPQITGQAGTLIAALDAFLDDGWGTLTATSVSVAGGVGTAVFAAGTFKRHAIVLIAGATPAALNGEARVLSTDPDSNSITFETDAPDTTSASGTITIKYAPVGGWAKAYSGANLAVYRSSDSAGSRFFYRVADTTTTTARVTGYVNMTAVSTGTGPFPTSSQVSGGVYWTKSTQANARANEYAIVADPRALIFTLLSGFTDSYEIRSACSYGFGDMLSSAPGGDAWAALVAGESAAPSGTQQSGLGTNAGNSYAARASSGSGAAVTVVARSIGGAQGYASGLDMTLGLLPNPFDARLRTTPIHVLDSTGTAQPCVRATVPGLLHIPQEGAANVLGPWQIVRGEGAGRLMALPAGNWPAQSPSSMGLTLIDITGPWR